MEVLNDDLSHSIRAAAAAAAAAATRLVHQKKQHEDSEEEEERKAKADEAFEYILAKQDSELLLISQPDRKGERYVRIGVPDAPMEV
jgi:hypothetical protein